MATLPATATIIPFRKQDWVILIEDEPGCIVVRGSGGLPDEACPTMKFSDWPAASRYAVRSSEEADCLIEDRTATWAELTYRHRQRELVEQMLEGKPARPDRIVLDLIRATGTVTIYRDLDQEKFGVALTWGEGSLDHGRCIGLGEFGSHESASVMARRAARMMGTDVADFVQRLKESEAQLASYRRIFGRYANVGEAAPSLMGDMVADTPRSRERRA